VGRVDTLPLFLILEEMVSVFLFLALGLSYIVFIMFRNVPSSPSFFRVFIMNGVEFCQRLFTEAINDHSSPKLTREAFMVKSAIS
jgi:hypothetical protein